MALATLSIDLEARLAQLEGDLGKASRMTEQHASRMEKAFASVRAAGAAIGTAIAGSLSVAAFTDFVQGSAEAAERIERLSQLAGSTTGEFQRYAAGAKSAGMDMDKFSDVMKDVQDKVGDFLATGGGELKDFFEQVAPKVGVTADRFRDLSGPQALQLFYTTLERANVGSKEMVFFLESIADDASTLAPLLRDNGAGFEELAKKAEAAGTIMSDQLVKQGVELNKQLKELEQNAQGAANNINADLVPALNRLLREFNAGREAFGGFGAALLNIGTARTFDNALSGLQHYQGQLRDVQGTLDRIAKGEERSTGIYGHDRVANLQAQATELQKFVTYYQKVLGLNSSAGAGRGIVPRDRETLDADTKSGGTWRPDPEKDKKKGAEKSEYERYIEQLNTALARTLDLSNAEQARYDIANGKLGKLTAAQEEYLVGLAGTLDAMKRPLFVGPEIDPDVLRERADEQKRFNDMLADTPTAKLELARADMELLAKAFETGEISAERFSEAASARLGNLPDETAAALDAMDERMKEFGANVQDALGDTIEQTLRGDFDNIGEMWGNLLLKMASQAMAAQLGDALFGDMFKAGGGSNPGLIQTAFAWLMSADGNAFDRSGHIKAFAVGGVFDQATPFTYGAGQLGVLGEAGPEAILPLKRGAGGKLGVVMHGGGSGGVVINPVYNIGQGVSRSEVLAAVSAANAQLKAEILRSQRRGGAHAS